MSFLGETTRPDSNVQRSSPNRASHPFVRARPTFRFLSVKSTRTSHINDEATDANVLD